MKIPDRKRVAPHIPFISLADIAWQLIIFFLLATSFSKTNALKVDIPAASNNTESKAQTITIQASETQTMLNGNKVEIPELQAKLKTLLAGKKNDQERAVMVLGRSDLSFQKDADIMYAVEQAGGILVMSEDK